MLQHFLPPVRAEPSINFKNLIWEGGDNMYENASDSDAFDLNSPITDTPNQVICEGVYPFRVIKSESGYFYGSLSTPPCDKIHLTLKVEVGNGQTAYCYTDLLCCNQRKWKICEYLKAIGVMRSGETIDPDWDSYVGRVGKAVFTPFRYSDQNGNPREMNSVSHFLAWDGSLTE